MTMYYWLAWADDHVALSFWLPGHCHAHCWVMHYHPCSPPKLLNHIMSCHVDGAPHVIKLDSSNILRLLLLPSLSKTSYIDTPLQGKYIRFIVLLLLSLHVFMYFTGSQTMVRYYFPVEVNMLYGALREQFTATTHFDRDPQLEQLTT